MNNESPVRLLLSFPLSFGPGMAELLRRIDECGSLQAAAAAMGMSYMKAWKMARGMNLRFKEPLILMQRGGKTKGGAGLTENGRNILALYREAVAAAEMAVGPVLDRMSELLPEAEPVSFTDG